MLGSSGTISKKSKGRENEQRHFIENDQEKCTKSIATEFLPQSCDGLSDSVFTAT
jgi:hypothetical protein